MHRYEPLMPDPPAVAFAAMAAFYRQEAYIRLGIPSHIVLSATDPSHDYAYVSGYSIFWPETHI